MTGLGPAIGVLLGTGPLVLLALSLVRRLRLAVRGPLSGHTIVGQVAWVLIAVAIMTAVFALLTGWLYGRPR